MIPRATPVDRRSDAALTRPGAPLERLAAPRRSGRLEHEAGNEHEARILALEHRVAALEARFRPADAADIAVLMEIALVVGGASFTSRQLFTLARTLPALDAALEAADIVNPLELGHFFVRLQARTIDGVAVERVDRVREGARWRIVVRR